MQTEITCRACTDDRLSAYLDAMLDGDQMRIVAAHLDDCPNCQAVCENLSRTRSLLRSLSTPSTPPIPEFWANAYRTARTSVPRRSLAGTLGGVARRFGLAVATAGTVVVLGVGIAMMHSLPTPSIFMRAQIGPLLDVAPLVNAHADYLAGQSFSDKAHLTMVRSEISAHAVVPGAATTATYDPAIPEALGNASSETL